MSSWSGDLIQVVVSVKKHISSQFVEIDVIRLSSFWPTLVVEERGRHDAETAQASGHSDHRVARI